MRNALRRLLRRRRFVAVDADALRELRELAVIGEAYAIVVAELENWLSLDRPKEGA